MTDLAATVRQRASDRCEYCLLPQAAFRRSFHVEHIRAKQHGGMTQLENLALACWQCNLKKGPNLAGVDPETGLIAPLFHPRRDQWTDHFELCIHTDSINVLGRSPTGRATVRVLGINDDIRPTLRYQLWQEGLYQI